MNNFTVDNTSLTNTEQSAILRFMGAFLKGVKIDSDLTLAQLNTIEHFLLTVPRSITLSPIDTRIWQNIKTKFESARK